MNTFCPVEIIIELPFIKCLLGTGHWPEYFTNISSFNSQDGLVREIRLFRTHTLRHYTISWMSNSLEVEKSRFELRADSKVQCKKCLQASKESFKVFADFLKNGQAGKGRDGTYRGSMTFTLTPECQGGWRSHQHPGDTAALLSHAPQSLEWHQNRSWENTVVS